MLLPERAPRGVAVVGDHGAADQFRGVADRPDRLVVRDGSGLAGHLHAGNLRRTRGAGVHRALEDLVDPVRDVLGDHPLALGLGRVDLLAGTGLDRGDDVRLAVHAAVGEGAVGRDQRQRAHLDRTQGEGRPGVEGHDVGALGGGLAHLQAQLGRHGHRLAAADRLDQLREVGVHRLGDTGEHVDRAAAVTTDRTPLAHQGERAVAGLERLAGQVEGAGRLVLAVGAHPGLERRRGDEGLEGRAALEALLAAHGVAHRVVVGGLALLQVLAPLRTALRHRDDVAGRRLEHGDHRHRRVTGVEVVGDRLLRLLLDLRIDGQPDRQATAVQVVLALVVVRAQPAGLVQQHPFGVVAHERVLRVGAVEPVLDHLAGVEGLGLGGGGLLVGDHAVERRLGILGKLQHPVDHVVAALDRQPRILHRVGGHRVADQTGQHRRLRQGQLRRRDAEVVPGGRAHAVGAIPVVADVEIALQDLILGELLLQRHREPHLTDLARHGVLGGGVAGGRVVVGVRLLQLQHADVLLGDGRAALGDALGGADQCTQGAGHVDGTVLVEPVVLDGDLRLTHDRRDVLELGVDPVLLVEVREEGAVGQFDASPLGRGGGLEVGRQVVEARRGVPSGGRGHADRGDHEPRYEGTTEYRDAEEDQQRIQSLTQTHDNQTTRRSETPVFGRAEGCFESSPEAGSAGSLSMRAKMSHRGYLA